MLQFFSQYASIDVIRINLFVNTVQYLTSYSPASSVNFLRVRRLHTHVAKEGKVVSIHHLTVALHQVNIYLHSSLNNTNIIKKVSQRTTLLKWCTVIIMQ